MTHANQESVFDSIEKNRLITIRPGRSLCWCISPRVGATHSRLGFVLGAGVI